jgi:hypothetical protein
MAYYRGGPKDGLLLLASTDGELLVFQEGQPPWPRYRLTTETIDKNGTTYPIAEYVETTPTG